MMGRAVAHEGCEAEVSVFRSIIDLQAAMNRFIEETNNELKPFVLTADQDKIIAAVRRGQQLLDSIH